MKVVRVTPMVLGTPRRNLTFVKVETDNGLYGLGEVRLNNRTNALLGYLHEAIPRCMIGIDPFEIELNEAVFAEHPLIEGHFNLFREGWEQRDTEK